ncbi:MAG TPA: nuclear transport factor 2 family protein [Acidimicrobiales bacterium]|jgi:ketosteroid isomerase-like protein|nr:nuclear transport factor 2 family protein [Acidimicrobiales bacterium]
MSESAAAAIATKCLEAWTSGDLGTVRAMLQDDVTYVGPLNTAGGVEAYLNGLAALAQDVRSAQPRKILVDGDDVCIIYDVVTESSRTVPMTDWYHVREGKIDTVRAYFDASGFTGGVGTESRPTPARPADREQGIPTHLPLRVSAETELADW